METHSVFLPGKSHGQRSLVGYNPRGRKESYTTEQLHLLTYLWREAFLLFLPLSGIFIVSVCYICFHWRFPLMLKSTEMSPMGIHEAGSFAFRCFFIRLCNFFLSGIVWCPKLRQPFSCPTSGIRHMSWSVQSCSATKICSVELLILSNVIIFYLFRGQKYN